MKKNNTAFYLTMCKIGDGWDRICARGAAFTTKYGRTVSWVLLIITGITALIARGILPDMVRVELGFDGGGQTMTQSAYILRMTLLALGSNAIFMYWQKLTRWLVCSFFATLAFAMMVLSYL